MVECVVARATTSEELARAAQAGDRRALNNLLARHKHEAYRVALRLVGRPHDADEVLQNAFERVLKHLRRYDSTRPFRPWLLRIVVNQARSHWRLIKVKSWLGLREDLPSSTSAPNQELSRKELRHALTAALNSLQEDQREAFVLKHVEGLSYDEIAAITGESAGALRVRTHRARRAVLEWCRANGVTFGSGGE